jgi:hypothetical protein
MPPLNSNGASTMTHGIICVTQRDRACTAPSYARPDTCNRRPRTSSPSWQSCRLSEALPAGWSALWGCMGSLQAVSGARAPCRQPFCGSHPCWCLPGPHLNRPLELVPLRRVHQAPVRVPEASTDGSHAESAPYVIEDAIRAWLAPVLYHRLSGLPRCSHERVMHRSALTASTARP